MIYLTNINLTGNEIQNAVIQPLATAPTNPKLGQIYCDSADSRIKWYDGNAWKVVGVVVESSATNGAIKVDGVEMTVYTLPTSSADTLGGIKVGAGLSIDASGKLSVVESTDMMKKSVYDTDGDGIIDIAANALKLGDKDPSHYATAQSVTELSTEVGKKVTAIEGKGLSTKDFTEEYENKLKGVAVGAEVNVQADWAVDDALSDAYIANKPTKLSEFANDEKFIDNTVSDLVNYYTKTDIYTKEEVNTKIGAIATISIVVPESGELPASGKSNELYLIPKTGGANPNAYDEYLWTGKAFEKIGDTEVDLSTYLTKTGDVSKTTVAFSPAEERVALATGDSVDVIIGKIAKYLTDLNKVAFSGSYKDLSDTPNHVKKQVYHMVASDGTQKVITVDDGSSILSVTLTDTITHEVVMADTNINNMTLTVKLSEAYYNGLDILVVYL